jgi:uncharacterized protein DUF6600
MAVIKASHWAACQFGTRFLFSLPAMRCLPFRVLFAAIALLALPMAPVRAGIALYTDHGRIDFDTVVQFLNPYGTWKKVDGLWAYTPLDHQQPYTHGRWLYTDFGWYWAGTGPISWVTEHYGYWKRGDDKIWAWYPGPYWVPNIVEFRATPGYLGWRSAQVDDDGNFVEAPDDRYSHTDEWSFVTRAAFTGPITPAVIASPAQAAQLLDDTTDCFHSYFTYRPITRPGPHPADFLGKGDGGMFTPMVYAGDSVAPVTTFTPAVTPVSTSPAPAKTASASAAGPSGLAATTNAPASAAGVAEDGSVPNDQRQVRYWTTMCLPNPWAATPIDAKPAELYIYRPDFYQDQEGIERRIGLWLDPSTRASMKLHLADVFSASHSKPAPPAAVAAGAPTPAPAVPAGTDDNAFRNEFEEAYPPQAAAGTPPASTKGAAGQAAPSGAVTNSAPNF